LPQFLAVVVLYNKAPQESSAFRSIQRSAEALGARGVRLKLLLYDNSPRLSHVPELPAEAEYRMGRRNEGTAAAYNFALAMAEKEGYDWLLTFDHDTTVPESYLERVYQIATELRDDSETGAIVPQVYDGAVFVSPKIVLRFGRSRRVPPGFSGFPTLEITGISSATVWKVNALREMGGFNPCFWLDFLDHWSFHVMQRHGKRIYVAGDVRVEHELSLNRIKTISRERFDNILSAESAFYDLYKDPIEGSVLTLRRGAMLCNELLRRPGGRFAPAVWNALHNRVLKSRKRRLEEWMLEASKRVPRN
jgi:GT2 family glycosyltransferase